MNDGDGVWRTIGGRRVFIKHGYDLSTAMRESGKFNNIIREEPSRKYNDDVKFICKIRGVYAIEQEYGKLKNYDVVLTDERKKHILDRRGKKDFDIIMKNMDNTLKNYDEIYDNSNRDRKGVCYVKRIDSNQYCAIMVGLSLKDEKLANSEITGMLWRERSYKQFKNKNKSIDRR